jgi:hypothetical protein
MTLHLLCEQYAAFRKSLGERFAVNGRYVKAFCRAMGSDIDIAEVCPDKVKMFSMAMVHSPLAGKCGTMRYLAFIDMRSVAGLSRNLPYPLQFQSCRRHSDLTFISLMNFDGF